MKPHYLSFEESYRRLRASNRTWNSAEDVAEVTALLQEFLKAPEVKPGGGLLELGCGAGEFTLYLLAYGFEVTGIDIAPTAVAWAREKLSSQSLTADLHVGSIIERLPFDDKTFDVVVDSHVLHCILGDDRPKALAEARRVLKAGGIFHVSTMCDEVHDPEVRAHFDPASRELIRDGVAIRQILPAAEIRAEVESAGFRIVGWRVRQPEQEHDQAALILNAARV